ncbi:Dcp2, box A domain-containing protein [Mycena amicta]|nr:Dcp2, box A domain-containing protein [Mycena amicta]
MASSSSSSPEIPAATAVESEHLFSYIHATHDEVLEDLSSRFILNLPDEELASLERICFQVEQAHWFYEDFIREQNPKFPTLPLKKFSAMLFHACPLLHQWSNDHEQAFNHFMQYKTRVPVCGAIMLNETWEKCILVKGWKPSSGWGFPKGKINEDEPPHACAIREVLEETGYNLAGQLNKDDVIELSIKEQKISLFIVPNVSEDYPFKTRTRKEISKIEWFKLVDLPTWKRNKASPGKFYLISPFIGPLKSFINERKPRSQPRRGPKPKKSVQNNNSLPRRDPPPHVQDTQESSSQSSSLDNGDPHTPSPRYSTAAPTVVQQQSNLDAETMDPHFARLLSSLTLSAVAAASSKVAEPPLTVETAEPFPEPTTPVPVTASSSGSRSLPGQNGTTSAPEEEAPSLIPMINPPPHHSLQPRTSFQSPSPLILSPRTSGTSSAAGSEGVGPAVSPTHSTASIRSLSSRRTVSTADISPYLPRSSQMPSSAKRMQQLALLESVADESAKMLQRQALPANPRPMMNNIPMYPLPPASVPPPGFIHDPMQVLYSSGHPIPPQFPPHDPFQVRPWTSQAFHRGMTANNLRGPMTPYGYPPNTPFPRPPGDNAGLLSILNGRRV